MTAPAAFPGFFGAVWLTLAAWMTSVLFFTLAAGLGDPSFAQAFGLTLGFGVVGTLAARRVPMPQSARLGLRGFRASFAIPIALLLPLVLVGSELDNVARAFYPPPDAAAITQQTLESLPTDTTIAAIQTAVLAVGLVPVLEEWFFRGVVQQGLVARAGAWRGVLATALLFALGHGAPGYSLPAWLAASAGALLYGIVFGVVRLASGSLLAPILLHAGMNALATLGLAFAGSVAIPGFNAPGAHTPASVMLPATLCVAIGLGLALRTLRRAGRTEPSETPATDLRV